LIISLRPRQFKRIDSALSALRARCFGLTYHGQGRTFPSILINALPQSGSTFIAKSLRRALTAGPQPLMMHGFVSSGTIDPHALEIFAAGNRVSQQHLPAEPHIVAALAMKAPRMVLNLRDPRAALVSRTHFIIRQKRENSPLQVLQAMESSFPADYFEWPFADQLAWQAENHLPRVMRWIDRWLAIEADTSNGLDVLVTEYGELIQDTEALLRRILDFYGISEPRRTMATTPKPGRWKFRAGSTEDWRTQYKPETLAAVTRLIPADCAARFNWK
jgi:hypothetical protein